MELIYIFGVKFKYGLLHFIFCVFLQVNRVFQEIIEYGMLHLYYTNSVNKLDTGYVVLNIENISLNWIFCGKYIKMLKE